MKALAGNSKTKLIAIFWGLALAALSFGTSTLFPATQFIAPITSAFALLACCIIILQPKQWRGRAPQFNQFISTAILQLAILFILIGLSGLESNLTTNTSALTDALSSLSWQNFLLPWPIIAVLCCALQKHLQRQPEKNIQITDLFPFIPKNSKKIGFIIADSLFNSCSIIAIILAIITLIMCALLLILNLFGISPMLLGSNGAFILSFVAIAYIARRSLKNKITTKYNKNYASGLILCEFSTRILITLLIASLIIYRFPALQQIQDNSLANLKHANNFWHKFIIGFWCCIIPLIVFVLKQNHSGNFGTSILSTLALPILLCVISSATHVNLATALSPATTCALGIIGAIIFIAKVSSKNNNQPSNKTCTTARQYY